MKKLLGLILAVGLLIGTPVYAITFTQEMRATSGDYGTINVTAVATQIQAQQNKRSNTIITNTGSETIWIGWDNALTTATGTPILSNASATITDCNLAIWGITATGEVDVRFLREVD